MKINSILIISALSLLSACGGAPKTDSRVVRLQADYDRYIANPELASRGGEELETAKSALRRLVDPRKRGKLDDDELELEIYTTDRLIQNATLLSRARLAEEQRSELAKEQEKLILASRIKEANEARSALENVKMEAQAALALKESALAEVERAKAEALAARAESNKLKNRLSALEARETKRGLLLTLGDVLFATNASTLNSGTLRNLEPLVEVLLERKSQKVIIEGHTDSTGKRDYNLWLSKRRAASVYNFLVDAGVSAERISKKGLGPDYPVATNATAAGRRSNRRVEVILPNIK